jgi:hypothetical protein
MSGYPRWIRAYRGFEPHTHSTAQFADLVTSTPSASPAKPRVSAGGALPGAGIDLAGLREHFARVSRVRGTGGEQDTTA